MRTPRTSTAGSAGRWASVIGLATTAILIAAVPAVAHVSVQPGQAEQGGYSAVVFRVPNERDDAATVKIQIDLPAQHPLSSVRIKEVPGWKAEVTKSKPSRPLSSHGKQVTEAVTRIVWSGGRIAPGQYQEFPVSMGALPEDAEALVFKALQTYEGGEVVRWIEEPRAGGEEPEHPAPILRLVKGAGEDGHGAKQTGAHAADAGATPAPTASASDSTARAVAWISLAVGVTGTALGVFGLRRGRAAGR
ncbi:YcnI family protein [Streptomyces sp. NBC_01142]|uniref:YcnI family copper-binding membrane protein n=1 Tax=Streptomyces sp. NBC_01142 TaxID=2975865 RepID=UPI0022514159|nr:YcnI family protein [Streptomyces sp. NBC_01142]MCX4824960.1 YcnI family protein [Streptomyces sp. NBC_01142]